MAPRARAPPRLDAVQARQVAAAVAGRTGAARRWDPGLEVDVVAVAGGPVAEVRAGTTRHDGVRWGRLRPPGL